MKIFSSLLLGAFLLTSNFSAQAASAPTTQKTPIPFSVSTVEGKRAGYLDSEAKKWVVTPQYSEVQTFTQESEALAWVMLPSGGYTLINTTGKQVIPPMPFDDVAPPSEGSARFKIDSKWGYLSVKDGHFILSPIYEQAREFSNGMAAVETKPGKWYYINPNGGKILSRDFSFAYSFIGDQAIALEMDGFYGIISRNGEWILPPNFGAIYRSSMGEKNFLVGKVDKGKKKFIPYYEIVNSSGLSINSLKFDEVKPFTIGGAPVRQGDKWGYINLEGQWLIEPQFEDVQDSQEANGMTVAAVQMDGLWGIINYTTTKVASERYTWLVKPTWNSEPDMSLVSSSIVRVDGFFYDLQGKKMDIYPNYILDGEVALRKGDKAAAKAAFEKALAAIPNDKTALYGIERSK